MTKQKIPAVSGNSVADLNDFAGLIVPDSSDDSKTFATLAASFALQGHSLVRASDGSLLAVRWGMFKPLADLGEAVRFLKLIGGAHE